MGTKQWLQQKGMRNKYEELEKEMMTGRTDEDGYLKLKQNCRKEKLLCQY